MRVIIPRRRFFVAVVAAASFTSSSVSPMSFAPTAAPRFDHFAGSIVGSWVNNAVAKELTVEEVMRSCGGAIQGVREVALSGSTDTKEDGVYLNRAHDGFVYWPCGSYTSGPVDIPQDGDTSSFLTSLQIGSNTRVVIEYQLQQQERLSGTRVFFLSKNAEISTPQLILFETPSSQFSQIDWNDQSKCRMPSPSHPWNLQRAKWEATRKNESAILQTTDASLLLVVPYYCVWVYVQGGGDEGNAIAATTVCIVDPTNCWAKALVRDYNAAGKLEAVTFKQGTVVQK